MQLFTKNLGIIICGIYCLIKLLHLPTKKKDWVLFSIFSMLLAAFSIYIDMHNPHYTMPILVLVMSFFLACKTKSKLSVSFTTATISFGISYSLFTCAILVIGTTAILFPEDLRHTFSQILCFIFQLLIMPIPFCFKRTKNGMPFLKKPFYSIPGMIISILILLVSIPINDGAYNPAYSILYILLIIFATLIYFYWKNNLTKTYLDKLNIKNIESLNAELLEKLQYIETLEQDNQQLAKIIHKDNKLIPAMEYAVESYIQESGLNEKDTQRGLELLDELQHLSADRKGMIKVQDKQCEKLPSCKVANIDHLLQYIKQKAFELDITFHVILDCDLNNLIRNVIEEDTLHTLLADLLENAIIATKYNSGKHIMLNIGMLSKHYSLHIFDSGIPFTKEVLIALGQKQITTHADDAGSGIGLIQTYEILRQCNASLLIDEFTTDTGLYTKKISVIFDKRNQYTLYTTRPEEEIAFLHQRGDLNVTRKY